MAHDLRDKLVITISSSALFDLTESHDVFERLGENAYRRYQENLLNTPLGPGVAFPFIKRLLAINQMFSGKPFIEVILLSHNSTSTGLRVMRSIEHHKLDISRAAFLNGSNIFPYLPAFNSSLFLSANMTDVQNAVDINYPAGLVLNSATNDEPDDDELRVAFDFDGVLADDSSEQIYQTEGIKRFQENEKNNASVPLKAGPLGTLIKKLAVIQRFERSVRNHKKRLRIAVITARNAPSHERCIRTLESWNITPDEAFFLGGVNKTEVLKVLKPHIFFDDQQVHLNDSANYVSSVLIPASQLHTKRIPQATDSTPEINKLIARDSLLITLKMRETAQK